MADIYQKIWDADQSGSGIEALTSSGLGDPARGYVRVKSGPASAELRLLDEVVLPAKKMLTYELARQLFDNFALAEREPETESAQEREEIHELLSAVVDSPPMLVAREYIQSVTGTTVTKERWYATLLEQWFRQFSQSGDPQLSGFEHVFVGEQEGANVQGYHFWYKYYLDDGFARTYDGLLFPGLASDRIEYIRSEAASGQEAFPESVTIAYKWNAPDYEAGGKTRPLTKPIGGFFVGCSVEGLMALGTVRAHLGARAPKEAVINGARYSLKLYRSDNNAHVRTFYPVFLGAAAVDTEEGEPVASRDVRIVGALVNPTGTDPGRETVTIVNTSSSAIAISGWKLVDKNGQATSLRELEVLSPGQFVTIRLLDNPQQAQLSNQGGAIQLVDARGQVVHAVSYTRAQAKPEGVTLMF